MKADWYVDPLGRFYGRFFDGQRWTEQVSDDGKLTTDPEWTAVDEEAAAEAALVLFSKNAEAAEPADNKPARSPLVESRALVVSNGLAIDGDRPVPSESDVLALVLERELQLDDGDDEWQAEPPAETSGGERRRGADRRQVNLPSAHNRRKGDRRMPDLVIPKV